MSPAISFSCVEKLPKLLDKSCCQTIRPVGKRKFKVGDKVTLYWKQRSPYKIFCSKCGKGHEITNFDGKRWLEYNKFCECKSIPITKTLGTGTITEVFEIYMVKKVTPVYNEVVLYNKSGTVYNKHEIFSDSVKNDIALRDGFNSFKEFSDYFLSHYDLNKTKSFQVIRWKWS